MDPTVVLISTLITLTPIFELRGAIPYALTQGMPIGLAYALCVAVNAAVGPIVFVFLRTIHRMLTNVAWYQRVVGRILERARLKVEQKVSKYGYLGLVLFVAIPLPITGAYTGSVGAWVLGLDAKRSYLAVLLGVMIAGGVVTIVTLLGIEALSIFTKDVPA